MSNVYVTLTSSTTMISVTIGIFLIGSVFGFLLGGMGRAKRTSEQAEQSAKGRSMEMAFDVTDLERQCRDINAAVARLAQDLQEAKETIHPDTQNKPIHSGTYAGFEVKRTSRIRKN